MAPKNREPEKRRPKCFRFLKLYYENLLSPASVHHGTSLTAERLIDSFTQDIMYAVSKREFLTLKHASVGLGLHSLTGQKLPLQVLSRLGHCMTYDQICEVETAQAELVQHLKSLSLPLPICPIDEESKVLTTFWWDNFDRNIETASGAESIHNTPGIMFQEESACTVKRNENVSIPKSKRRSIRLEDMRPIQATAINSKKDPLSFAEKDPVQVENHEQMYCNNLLIV